MVRNIFILGCFFFFVKFSTAQISQITEKESQLQSQFIDATKELTLARYDQAEKILLNIVKENEAIGATHFELGKVYEAKGDDQRALGSYTRAIALEKTNKWYYLKKLDLLKKINAYGEAANLCESIAQLPSATPEDYYEWTNNALKANNPELAISALDKLEAKQGINFNIVDKKTQIYESLGQHEKTRASLSKLTETFPTCVTCLSLQAAYLGDMNMPDEATKIWKKVLELDPSNTNAKIAVAAGMKIAGDDVGFLESIKSLFVSKNVAYDDKMKQLIPYIQKVAVTHDEKLGTALDKALKMLDETNPDNAKTKSAMADVAQNTGRFKEAVELYQQCLKLDKSVFSVWEQLLYLQDQTRDYSGMLKTSNDLYDLFPGLALANYWHGLALIKSNKADQAMSVLDEGLALSSKNPALQYKFNILKAQTYALKKDLAKSQESYLKAKEINSKVDWAYAAEARTIADLKSPGADALSLCDEALKIDPNSLEALHTKAYILLKAASLDKSKSVYELAFKNGGMDIPEILEEYGDLMLLQNNSVEASKYWNLALEKGIETVGLRKKIDAIKS